jgi:hypothetical protein
MRDQFSGSTGTSRFGLLWKQVIHKGSYRYHIFVESARVPVSDIVLYKDSPSRLSAYEPCENLRLNSKEKQKTKFKLYVKVVEEHGSLYLILLFTKMAQVCSPLMNPAKNLKEKNFKFNSKEKQQIKCKLYVKVIMPAPILLSQIRKRQD